MIIKSVYRFALFWLNEIVVVICWHGFMKDTDMKNAFIEKLYQNPVIVAVKNMKELEKCVEYENEIVFLLFSDICNLQDNVKFLKEHDKFVFVHTELIYGLSNKEITVDYIKKHTEADGIISTRDSNTKRAEAVGLYSVLRYFILDSMALDNTIKEIKTAHADAVEILPGIMPKIVKAVSPMTNKPVISGGLVSCKSEIIKLLNSGAAAISTTNSDIWSI